MKTYQSTSEVWDIFQKTIRMQKKESSVMNSINNVEKQDQRQNTGKTD